MAGVILTNVLNKTIPIEDLFKWLTADDPEEKILFDIVQNGATRTEFISYFLNNLREQCKSILPESKEIQEKHAVKKPDEAQSAVKINVSAELKYSSAAQNYTNKQEYSSDQRTPAAFQGNYHPAMIVHQNSPIFHGIPDVRFSPRATGAQNPYCPLDPGNFTLTPHQAWTAIPPPNVAYRYPTVNCPANYHPGNLNFQANQSPGNWNHGYIMKYPTQLSSPNQSSIASIDGNYPDSTSSPRHMPGVVPCLNQAQMQASNANLSFASGNFDRSFSNASLGMSSPSRLDNSITNRSSILNSSLAPFSPVSPLYANNSSILCSPKIDKSHHHTPTSNDNSSNNANASKTSTPKSGGGQKQSICLGDFVKSEPKRKMTRKEMRAHFWKQSQAEKNTETKSVQNSSKAEGKSSETKSTRRIKPTRLNVSGDKQTQGPEVFGIISRPTAVNPKFVEAPSSDKSQEELSFEVERGLLKLERKRQPKMEAKTEVANVEPKLPNKTKSESTIVPCLDLVDRVETLDLLVSLYCGILDRNLMSNPMTELYFLMTLLTSQYKAANDSEKITDAKSTGEILETLKDDLGCTELSDEILAETSADDSTSCEKMFKDTSFNEDSSRSTNPENSRDTLDDSIEGDKKYPVGYLDTPHNCVYFATSVMFNQQNLLTILDRATLKLLCENQQIAIFRPELQKYLNDIYTAKCLQTNRMKQMDSRNSQTNVCFQVDTDNRETFPSMVAFTLFRKQRDLFYEILKDWEDNHLESDWSYQRALKNKINYLLSLHTDAVNYCHLAKLFVSQLLVSSGQSGKMEDPMNDESWDFLKSLKDWNPEKFLQLKGRLVTPLNSTGPVPQPMFPGVQEFYKEFIFNASNWKFNVILENTLIHEIMELNDTQFARSEIESAETTVDESTKQRFVTCVSSLRLLAKFTSFTLSLPFRSVENSPEWLLSQIQLRGRVVPSLDLRSCLLDALKQGRLSLTVPWIVQYMAMLDPVTLRLPYYVNIGELLYCIYRMSNHYDPLENDDFVISPETSMLMIFTIGWLFELINFPRDLYALWQMNYNAKKLRIFDRTSNTDEKHGNFISIAKESSKEFVKYKSTLDKLDIIDDRAFYECCPFLTEFKILLISGNAILGNSSANRHITPVSSQLSQPSFTVKTKSLQLQLEEAFFHGQPSSVRKTVDFVSERVASSCVKYICNVIIPSSKRRDMESYIESKNGQIDLISKDEDSEEKVRRREQGEFAEPQMRVLAATIKESVKRDCSQKIPEMCEIKTIKSIESLLSDDALSSVKETCVAIARRMSIERIEQWIDSHIVESLFLKNINFELKKLLKERENNCTDKTNHHNSSVSSPTEVIQMMRGAMWELLERQNRWAQLSVDSVTNVLKCFHEAVTQRVDLVENWEKSLYAMSIEYCLLLLTHREDLFTKEVQESFLKIWKMNAGESSENESLFVRIISPRNIRLITDGSESSVMKVFARLLKALLKENLLSIESLSDQCLALFRQEWPERILTQLSQCLKDVVSDHKCSGPDAERMKYLLAWIATTYGEMEIYD